jgi:hypothetical protein
MSYHVYYECWMVESLGKELNDGVVEGREGTPAHNANLESFLVHVRILTDFFYSNRQEEDDAIAEDFLEDPICWKKARTPRKKTSLNIHERVAKEIVHLTHKRADRTDPSKRIWYFLPIAADVKKLAEIFYEIVPKDLLTDLWNEYRKKSNGN